MTTALLQTTYFGPIQWYQKLFRYDRCVIEQHDSYHKQTFRNRCVIATANGRQALTVPVSCDSGIVSCDSNIVSCDSVAGNAKCLVRDIRISDHNQWRRVHWNALASAYSESPFFDYYVDDLRPFFERKYEFLVDFNEEIRQKICELLDIRPQVEYSKCYTPSPIIQSPSSITDFRSAIDAKHPLPDDEFVAKRYWQVFQHKHGFLPNLSILDLLFCMGPESVFYL
ncbi:MAG: WbqC family protein [Prevotella sp.]|nr:WbqC family protein [Prevotella sp.]MBQ9187603.1 WbqC family protein [Prevotella sp.]